MNPEKHHFNFTSEELNNFLKIAASICIGVLTLLLLVVTINQIKSYSTIGETNTIQNIISVSGKSEMDVKPDVTTFSWNVEGEGKTIDAAQSKAAEINNKAIAFVKEKGVKEADIKTISLNTYPKYETNYKNCLKESSTNLVAPAIYPPMPPCAGESVISGYTTSISIEVKVRDIDKNQKLVSDLIGGLATIGVKPSTPSNTIDNIDAYKSKVKEEAIVKARIESQGSVKTETVDTIHMQQLITCQQDQ
jgi:uncharacterized protein YggE